MDTGATVSLHGVSGKELICLFNGTGRLRRMSMTAHRQLAATMQLPWASLISRLRRASRGVSWAVQVRSSAVSFHRQKRSKAFIHSELEQIEGVGDKTVQTLLRHFRTVEKVRAANIEELSALVGAAKAKKIRAFFEK